jgi:hypothetical protein
VDVSWDPQLGNPAKSSTLGVLFFMLIANNIHSFRRIMQEVDDIEGKIKNIFEIFSEMRWLCRLNDFKPSVSRKL